MTATTLAAYRSAEGKAVSAHERMRSRMPRSKPSASVRTRKMGFSIGGFGFTYTTKDIDLVKGQQAQVSDLAMLSPDHDFPDQNLPARRTPEPDTTALNRKRGQSAYASQLRSRREESMPNSILISVV